MHTREFSQRAKDVLLYSREEAERLGNNYVGPEHLLLGILRDGEGPAVTALKSLKVDIKKVKSLKNHLAIFYANQYFFLRKSDLPENAKIKEL